MTMKNFNLIKKAFAILSPKSTVLPILECVLVKDDTLTITDLNTTIVFKGVGINLDFVQYGKDFIKACGFIENPIFTKNGDKLNISGNEETFTYRIQDVGDFPKIEASDSVFAGNFSAKDGLLIQRALSVVGRDELRPALCTVAVKDGFIMATDGHCAIYEKSDFAYSKQILIGKKSARLMGIFTNSEFTLSLSETRIKIENQDVIIIQRIDDNRFPDLLGILPKEQPIEMTVDKKEFMAALKKAQSCSSTFTRAVILGVNGRLMVSSEDNIHDRAYKRQISCGHIGENIEIGLNVNMLMNIIGTVKAHELKFNISAVDKPVVINGNALQMPINLNNY
jgi:DNA polymerase-3 subunit beta